MPSESVTTRFGGILGNRHHFGLRRNKTGDIGVQRVVQVDFDVVQQHPFHGQQMNGSGEVRADSY